MKRVTVMVVRMMRRNGQSCSVVPPASFLVLIPPLPESLSIIIYKTIMLFAGNYLYSYAF